MNTDQALEPAAAPDGERTEREQAHEHEPLCERCARTLVNRDRLCGGGRREIASSALTTAGKSDSPNTLAPISVDARSSVRALDESAV